MRVLFVDSTKTFGGAFELVLSLLSQLKNKPELQAGMVSAQPPSLLCKRMPPEVPFFCFERKEVENDLSYSGFRKFWKIFRQFAINDLYSVLKLWKFLVRFDSSIVHLNNLITNQYYAPLSAKLKGSKCVITHNGFEFHSSLTRAAAKLVDHHIAISTAIYDDLLKLNIPASKITIIRNGIDLKKFSPEIPPADLADRFGIDHSKKVFSYFGRLVGWKGVDIFLLAAKEVIRTIPNAHALIVGNASDGEKSYEQYLKDLAVSLGIQQSVTFVNYQENIPELMRASSTVVHCSTLPEPFGLVPLEAMACGIPVVAMNEGGPLDIIRDGIDGLLAPPKNPNLLAIQIIKILENPDLASKLAKSGRERAEKEFSLELMTERYFNLYQRIHS